MSRRGKKDRAGGGGSAKRSAPSSLDWRLRREGFGWTGGASAAGVKVDPRSMISLAVARRCIDAIASDLAAMPMSLVQVPPDSDEERPAKEHRAFSLFAWSPDGGMTTPMRFRQALMANTLIWGNGYAEIVASPDKTRVELQILNPALARPFVDVEGVLKYQIEGKEYDGSKVVHVAGMGFDGLRGYPPWQLHAQTFGVALAAQQFGGAFLGNGAFPGGFVESDFEMGEEAFTRFRDAFIRQHAAGVAKAGKVGFLPPGFRFNSQTVNPQAAQLLERQLFDILEVCRVFGVPPYRAMQYENMHYSTVEAVKSEFAQTTLLPWATAFEQSLNLRLLSREEILAGFTFRHDFTAYMRADAATRAQMYRTLWSTNSISSEEPRLQEGYAPSGRTPIYFSDLQKARTAPQPPPAEPQS